MQIIDEEIGRFAGIALSKPATWLKTGIDPMRAMRVSVLGFGGWLGLPSSILFSADSRHPEVFLEFFNEHSLVELLPTEGKPTVYMDEKGRAVLGFLGSRMHMLIETGAEDSEDILRSTLGDLGRARTIAADPAFDLVKKSGSKSLPLALFFNFGAFEQLADNPEFHLPTSLLMALGPEGLVAGAALAEDSALLALKPGADSKTFLARFDQPTFAFSVSLSGGLKDLRDVIAELMPFSLPDLDQVIARLPDILGMNVEAFARQIVNGSGGMLFYPGAVGQSRPDIVVYMHLQDPAAMQRQLAPELPHGGYRFELHRESEGQYLLRVPAGPIEIILGVIDEFLLIGNSRERIDRMAKGEAKGWQPRIGGQQLFAAELNPDGIAELLAQNNMDKLIPFIGKVRLFGQLELKPGGLLARVEPFGDRSGKEMVGDFLEACLLAYAKEIQPREPEFEFVLFDAEKPKPRPKKK